MRLEKFNRNKKQKKIYIGVGIFLILLIGGIILYKTYAFYEEKKEYNVLKEIVPNYRASEYLTNLSEQENSGIVAFNHEATSQTKALTDYRYVGSNPDNYVYFGCSDNCTEENLYRIIGVIPTQSTVGGEYENRVKLIKASNYEEKKSGLLNSTSNSGLKTPTGFGYLWNNAINNSWEKSSLQKNVLNGIYWNDLGDYQNYIAPSVWYLGALSGNDSPTYTSEQFYTSERSNTQCYSKGALNYTNNIGLMYPSDYGYSIGQSYINSVVDDNRSDYVKNSWLYILEEKYSEWTITSEGTSSNAQTFSVYPDGSIGGSGTIWQSVRAGARPTFYLKTNVLVTSGNGKIDNPYRLSINE